MWRGGATAESSGPFRYYMHPLDNILIFALIFPRPNEASMHGFDTRRGPYSFFIHFLAHTQQQTYAAIFPTQLCYHPQSFSLTSPYQRAYSPPPLTTVRNKIINNEMLTHYLTQHNYKIMYEDDESTCHAKSSRMYYANKMIPHASSPLLRFILKTVHHHRIIQQKYKYCPIT